MGVWYSIFGERIGCEIRFCMAGKITFDHHDCRKVFTLLKYLINLEVWGGNDNHPIVL
jgi:hypothetical protein